MPAVPSWVFLGSDPIALPLLEALVADGRARLGAVWTQPDRPSGRGQRVRPNPIAEWARGRGVPLRQPERPDATDVAALAAVAPAVAVVMAYGHLLRPAFLAAAGGRFINLHTSLLPRYRGASPIQTAVACGERETGVSLMRIVPRLDAGPVIDAERVAVDPADTALEVEGRMARACVPLVLRHWGALLAGTAEARDQDESAATWCRRLVKEDGVVDFRAAPAVVAARINGLRPWPGVRVEAPGGVVLTLGRAVAAGPGGGEAGVVPGTVRGAGSAPEGLRVACGVDAEAGEVRLLELQRPGGRMLPAAEFVRGFPLPPGTVFPSAAMPPLLVGAPGQGMPGR